MGSVELYTYLPSLSVPLKALQVRARPMVVFRLCAREMAIMPNRRGISTSRKQESLQQ